MVHIWANAKVGQLLAQHEEFEAKQFSRQRIANLFVPQILLLHFKLSIWIYSTVSRLHSNPVSYMHEASTFLAALLKCANILLALAN